MSKLVKGSPAAMAWAKKMKKARIRAAGKRTEREFFGPGGHFADEAAAKARTNPLQTHQLTNEEADRLWKYVNRIKNRGKHRYAYALLEYILGGQRGLGPNWKSYGIGIMTEQAVRNRFATEVPALLKYDENPGRPHGKFRSCVEQVSRQRPQVDDPKAVCGAALNPGRRTKKYRHGVSAYDMAVQHGFPYIRGDGHSSKGVWYNRFTKTADGSGPALYVGYNEKTRRWIIYGDEPLHKGIPGVGQTPEENQPRMSGVMLARYVAQEKWKPVEGGKSGAFTRLVGDLFQILEQEKSGPSWWVLYRTSLTPQAGPSLSLGIFPSLDRAMIAANRQASDYRPASQRNPITIIGNPPNGSCPDPPGSVNSTVSGVLYCNVIEIQAEKKVKYKGFWYHPFRRKSRIQMLALDNGDLCIHSVNGTPLWTRE